MDSNEAMARRWQAAIIDKCRRALSRDLTPSETTFITSRLGGIALEMIDDTVTALADNANELERYLNHENKTRE